VSDPTTPDRRTLAVYDVHAAAYGALGVSPEDARHLSLFAEQLPAGARILDLGCGAGLHSKLFLDAGFDVVPLDGSAGIAEEARRLTGLDVRVMGFDQLKDVAAFDGVWAAHTLHHVPHAAFHRVVRRVARALRPGGQVFAAVKAGQGEVRDKLDRLYAFHSVAGFAGAWEDAGFSIRTIETYDATGFDGSPCRVLALFASLN